MLWAVILICADRVIMRGALDNAVGWTSITKVLMMETVAQAPACQCFLVTLLPVIFLVVSVAVLFLVIRYFIRLGNDVRAIRQLLEEQRAHSGKEVR